MKNKIIFSIILLGIFTLFTSPIIVDYFQDAEALKSKGTPLLEIHSKKICGLELCSTINQDKPQPPDGQIIIPDTEEPIPDEPLSLLFVQTAHSGTFVEKDGRKILTLVGISPTTVWFSDRPQRITGHEATELFTALWAEGEDSFAIDPPNAALTILDGVEESDVFILELSNAIYDPDSETLQYDVVILEEGTEGLSHYSKDADLVLPSTFGPSALFIDNFFLDVFKDIGKAVVSVVRAIEHAVVEVVHDVETLGKAVGKEFKQIGTTVVKDERKFVKFVEHDADVAFHFITKEGKQLLVYGKDAEHFVEHTAEDAYDDIKKAATAAEDAVKKESVRIMKSIDVDDWEENALEGVQKVIKGAQKVGAQIGGDIGGPLGAEVGKQMGQMVAQNAISSVMSGKVGGGDIEPPTFTDLKSIVAATRAHNIISGGDDFPAKNLAEKMIFGKDSKLPTHVHKAVLSLMDKIPSDALSSIINDGKYGVTKEKIAENITLHALYTSQSSLEELLKKYVEKHSDKNIDVSKISTELQPIVTDSIMNSFDEIITNSVNGKLPVTSSKSSNASTELSSTSSKHSSTQSLLANSPACSNVSTFGTPPSFCPKPSSSSQSMAETIMKAQQAKQEAKMEKLKKLKSEGESPSWDLSGEKSSKSSGETTSQFSNELSGEPTGELTGELDMTSDIPEQLFQTPEMGEIIGEFTTGEDITDSITDVLDDFKGEPSDFLAGESGSTAGEIAQDQLSDVGEDAEGEMSDSLADLGEEVGESIAEEIGELVA